MAGFADLEVWLSLERAGLKGRTVTVIDRLPPSEEMLNELTKKLKGQCGLLAAAFVHRGYGRIELDGDKRDAVRPILKREGIRCKG